MTEREKTGIELLLSEPAIVAWLEPLTTRMTTATSRREWRTEWDD